jgi:hypothetical protein
MEADWEQQVTSEADYLNELAKIRGYCIEGFL